jgi:AbrB-like transcriptional regulator
MPTTLYNLKIKVLKSIKMPRITDPSKKKVASSGKTAKGEGASSGEKIIPLTGKALKLKLKELSNLSKSETAKGCGYYSIDKSGKVKVNLTKFYDAVLQSTGINVNEDARVDRRGREASYRATVHQNGQILIGAAYTKALNLSPGDEFEIKMGYKHIYLKAIEKKA